MGQTRCAIFTNAGSVLLVISLLKEGEKEGYFTVPSLSVTLSLQLFCSYFSETVRILYTSTMKKLFLSGAVVISFLLYSSYVKSQDQQSVLIPATQTTPLPTPANIPSGEPPMKPSTTFLGEPTLTPTAAPTKIALQPTAIPTPKPTAKPAGQYKDGSYTGSVADAFYGNIQVRVTISSGKISDVQFLQYPNDRRTSIEINTQAMPMLKSEAIAAQSANVNIISGATDSSQAFRESLASALSQAK